MPNDQINPSDSTITTTPNPLEEIVSKKNPKLVLIIVGIMLVGFIFWGVVQINNEADKVANSTDAPAVSEVMSPELSQEEQIRAQLEALAAEDAVNQVPVSEEEIKAQLEALAAEDAGEQVEVSEEEIRAQLEALAGEEAPLEAQ
jgi:preprotein translocase subunit SecF